MGLFGYESMRVVPLLIMLLILKNKAMYTFIKICRPLKAAQCLSYSIVSDRLKIVQLVKQLQTYHNINRL